MKKLKKMKWITSKLMTSLVIIGGLASMSLAHAGTKTTHNLAKGSQSDSVSHRYQVYTPTGYDGSTALPMVFVLHGCHQTDATVFNEFGWDETADAHNFILVAPHSNADATPTVENPECWNYWIAGHQDRNEGMNVDLVRIGEQVESNYNVNANRRYVTGLSSGGFMTTIAIATYNDYWTAGVAMAGGGYKETSNSANTNSSCSLNFTIYKTPSAIASDLSSARNASPSSYDAPIMFMNSNYDCTVDIQGGITGSEGFAQFHGASLDSSLTADCSVSQIACENKKYTDSTGRILVETYFYDGPSDSNPQGNFHATDKSKGHYMSGAKATGQWSSTWGQNAREAAWAFFNQFDRAGDPTNPEEPTDPEDPTDPTCNSTNATLDAHVAAGRAYTSGSSAYCETHTSSTYSHVSAGRAVTCNAWYACAADDGVSLGLSNTYNTATVYESPASVYTTAQCSANSGIEYYATGSGELLGTNGNSNVELYETSAGNYSKIDPANCGGTDPGTGGGNTGSNEVVITPTGTGTAGSWGGIQTLNGMSTYTYTPQNPPAMNGKRALMIALHGCSMDAADAKNGYNWETSADMYGMVVVAPSAPNGGVIAGCWDYYGNTSQTRTNRHNDNLIGLVDTMLANSSLNIDPAQVYISGLSSGGGQTITMGCVAPDVFAGLGINAGPAPGTSSGQIGSVAGTTASQVNTCTGWAGSNAADFDTQITSVVHGASDYTVATGYGQRDFDIMASIYGVSQDAGTNSIAGGGTEITATKDGKEVVSYISVAGMGHAWPAGEGPGCNYCDTNKVNYPEFLSDWLFHNNRRVIGNAAPVVTLNGDAQVNLNLGDTFSDPGATANDLEDGTLTVTVSGAVDTSTVGNYTLTYSATDSKNASHSVNRGVSVIDPNVNTAPVVTLNGAATMALTVGDNFTNPGATATDVEDGTLSVVTEGSVDTSTPGSYTITYTATDMDGASDNKTLTVTVAAAPSASCFTDTVGNHLSAGRVYTFGGYNCKTVGGDDQVNSITYTCGYLETYGGNPTYSIEETSSGVFNKVSSCQ